MVSEPVLWTRLGVTCNIWSMETPTENQTGPQRVQKHRDRLRAQGMRPIQLWVVDVRAPEFVRDAGTQSAAVAAGAYAGDDQAFIDALSHDAP